MKYFNKLSAKLAGLSFLMATATLFMFGGTAGANASCLYQYNSSGNFATSATPVFNSICGVPGVGNEPDFVRIRQSSTNTTNPTATQDEAATPAYSVGGINSDCTPGEQFDVWNYLHNNAYTQDNNNGSGSAVAHNVTGDLSAPLGTAAQNFNFGYTVSASNAATVSDSASLACSNKVTLSLVPGSIHVLISPTGSWQDLIPESTSSLNTPLSLGNPVWGSGDQWGCFNYRILIVYEVQITPVTQTPPVCTSVTNDVADIESVNLSNSSGVNVTGYTLNLYKGSSTAVPPVATETNIQLPFTFSNLEKGQTYTVTGTVVTTNFGNITSGSCKVAFMTPTTPPSTPPSTPPTTTPTTLVNTGPGSTAVMVGLFAAISAAGTLGYRKLLKRNLAKN